MRGVDRGEGYCLRKGCDEADRAQSPRPGGFRDKGPAPSLRCSVSYVEYDLRIAPSIRPFLSQTRPRISLQQPARPMTTAFYTHPDCRGHDMGRGHPECPARLDAIDDHLIASGLRVGL